MLNLVADGKTDREIAEILYISRRTVNFHVANILGRLAVHSRQDAVARAHDLGLLRLRRTLLQVYLIPARCSPPEIPYRIPMF